MKWVKVVSVILLLSVSVLLFTMCSTSPDKIDATYVSPLQYSNYSCDQIRQELIRINRRVAELSGKQQKEATKDAVAMTVALVIFWPALFLLIGPDQKAEISRLKGEYEALETVAIEKSCGYAEELEDAKQQREEAESPAEKLPPSEGFVLVEAGSFQMGSAIGGSDESPVHTVHISKPFYISKYEVTQKEWREVMGKDPSNFKGANLPVASVTWYDAVEFCNALSLKEGLKPVYSGSGKNIRYDFSANGYRLPTEAEWEYAARGGNKSSGYKYSGSNSAGDVGWYFSNSDRETHLVGKKRPNELGIYDMSGNVWEWCWDWKGDYTSGSVTDPRGRSSDLYRVLRGGGWSSYDVDLRAANRSSRGPGGGTSIHGFRPVRTAE